MKAAIKKRWVRALRSGRYKQTANSLKDDGGYCCLGVLCVVVGARMKADSGEFYLAGKQISDRENEVLANDFRKSICLNARSEKKLTLLNDGDWNIEAKNFKQIADYIERHY